MSIQCLKITIAAFLHYRYSQHLHTFLVWLVIILLMRANCAGPARVNTQLQSVCCTYRLQCTTYIRHIYFVHRFYIYLNICMCNVYETRTLHTVCSVYIPNVFVIHYKYIVEVLGKTIRRTMMIDNSFERKFHGACYRPRFTIFYRLILNKVHDNSKT